MMLAIICAFPTAVAYWPGLASSSFFRIICLFFRLPRYVQVAGETLDLSSSFRDSPRAMPVPQQKVIA